MNAIQENGSHRDEAVVFDYRPVDDGTMADGDALPDPGGDSIIYVDDRPVLDVAVLPDLDRIGVAAHNGGRPNRDVPSEGDVPDDHGERVDEGQRVDGGQAVGRRGRGEGVPN